MSTTSERFERVPLTAVMDTAYFARFMQGVDQKPWSTKRARRWLRRKGALVEVGFGRGGKWGTTVPHLRRVLPHLVNDLEIIDSAVG